MFKRDFTCQQVSNVRIQPGYLHLKSLIKTLVALIDASKLRGGVHMKPSKLSSFRGKTPIRIILADDHQIVRQGIRMLLEAEPDMVVIAEACNGREVLRQAQELLPDVIIMDITMPELNGIEATRHILAIAPDIKVIALSMNADSRFVLTMFRSGVVGYLLKECSQGELVKAIRVVIKGKTYLGPGISDIVIKDFLTGWQAMDGSVFSTLTIKEREVLQLIAEGKSTRQIAGALYVSIKTIESHRKQIMDKLGIRSIAELTKYAIREGLTSG
jgi:DNA-binding NarL/FixJ family response regulator